MACVACIAVLFSSPVWSAEPAKGAAAPAPQYGGILRVVDTPPGTPFGIPWQIIGVSVCSAMPALEPLVRMDRNGEVYPCLAESWKVADDKRSITLAIRKGVKFHDGSELNAEAVRFNLQAEMDAKNGGTLTWASVEVLDPFTVRINFKDYDNRLFVNLASTMATIISPTALQKNGEEWAKWHPVGTGPFEFVSYQRDVSVKYKKFNDYWDKGKPYLDEVELRYMRDPQTVKASMLANEIDIFGENGGELIAEMKTKGYKEVSADNGIVMLFPDSANADSPFAKKQVREAVSLALDREGIAKARGFGYWKPAYQFAYPEQSAFLEGVQDPYDPDKAKQVLAQAGYPNGFKTKLIGMPTVVDRDALVAIQQLLAEIGIQAEVEIPEMSRYRQYQTQGWQGLLTQPWGFFASYPQLIGFYFYGFESFISTKRPPELESLFTAARSTVVPEKDKTQAINRLLCDDRTLIPVYNHTRNYVVKPNVFDTGHMKWSSWPWWTPGSAWLGK